MRQHGLVGASFVDLGCGFGWPVIRSWRPRSYIGLDISSELLERHLLKTDPHVLLIDRDLEEFDPTDLASIRDDRRTVVISIFSFHYLAEPYRLVEKIARPGRWFCFVVANAEHDRASADNDRIVHLLQEGQTFTYFLHELHEYIRWIGSPMLLETKQCGASVGVRSENPYYLIGGRW
ncbi:MAG TPA: class I SAM-dependent methyltransferase [Xanthobacteraceae bacterium]|nr:class I SAM-dependent methyltransferase [Xanthobacteraceae bacterium]